MAEVKPLSRKQAEDFTKEWYAIQDGKDEEYTNSEGEEVNYIDIANNQQERRKAFDDLYDRATNAVFTGWSLDEEEKDIMRKLWLKIGFEGMDGTEAPFLALKDVLDTRQKNSTIKLGDTLNLFYSGDMTNSDFEKISGSSTESRVLKNLLSFNDSLYKYPSKEIVAGLEAIYNIVKDNPDKWKTMIFSGKPGSGSRNTGLDWNTPLKNLRELAKEQGVKERTDYVKVPKLKERNVEELSTALKLLGINLEKADDVKLLADVVNSATGNKK